MKVFRIMQAATGTILWIGAALDPLRALDAMASAAGYRDRTRIPDHLRAGGLHVARRWRPEPDGGRQSAAPPGGIGEVP